MTFFMAVTTIMPMHAQEPADSVDTSENARYTYSGGAAKAKRAITQTSATSITADNVWVTLPLSTISYFVPLGTTEMFNVAFSAECAKFGGNYLRIRILDNGVPLQPYDGFQVFCSAPTYATHSGLWVKRAGYGVHNLTVQFLQNTGSASIDDWTFELVVYD
jgi:hypothetical protein